MGGHVESIECGVFRSDLPVNFVIDTKAIDDVSRNPSLELLYIRLIKKVASKGFRCSLAVQYYSRREEEIGGCYKL